MPDLFEILGSARGASKDLFEGTVGLAREERDMQNTAFRNALLKAQDERSKADFEVNQRKAQFELADMEKDRELVALDDIFATGPLANMPTVVSGMEKYMFENGWVVMGADGQTRFVERRYLRQAKADLVKSPFLQAQFLKSSITDTTNQINSLREARASVKKPEEAAAIDEQLGVLSKKRASEQSYLNKLSGAEEQKASVTSNVVEDGKSPTGYSYVATIGDQVFNVPGAVPKNEKVSIGGGRFMKADEWLDQARQILEKNYGQLTDYGITLDDQRRDEYLIAVQEAVNLQSKGMPPWVAAAKAIEHAAAKAPKPDAKGKRVLTYDPASDALVEKEQ